MRKLILLVPAVAIVLASAFGLFFLLGYVGNSAARVNREHGIKVPASAREFVCRGDAWMHLFGDAGAASAFEMASSDVPRFVSQLTIQQTSEGGSGGVLPLNARYQIHRTWMSGIPMKIYRCASSKGNSLAVQIWPIDDAHVGVLLYTDWN